MVSTMMAMSPIKKRLWKKKRFPRRRRSMIQPNIHNEDQEIKDTKLWATRKHYFVSFLDECVSWCIAWHGSKKDKFWSRTEDYYCNTVTI
jgi:hypothetical protein